MFVLPPEYSIRPVTDLEPLTPVVGLQSALLGLDPRHSMPPRLIKTHAGHGGSALCLFDARQHMRGFAFHFPGQLDGRIVVWAYRLAVEPGAPAHAADALRQAQYRIAHDAGFAELCWTVKPWDVEAIRRDCSLPGIRCRRWFPDYTPANGFPSPLQAALLLEWPCKEPDPSGPTMLGHSLAREAVTLLRPDPVTRDPLLAETAESPVCRITLPLFDAGEQSLREGWRAATDHAFRRAFTGGELSAVAIDDVAGLVHFNCSAVTEREG